MLFVVVLERGAVVEVVAHGGFGIEAHAAVETVFGSGCDGHRPLPGTVVEALLQQGTGRGIDLEATVAPQLASQAQGQAQVVEVLVAQGLVVEGDGELGVQVGVVQAGADGQARNEGSSRYSNVGRAAKIFTKLSCKTSLASSSPGT